MRITRLYASNFLSFAPSPNPFVFEHLKDDLTVLVGPNGHGKSNTFRLVQVLLNAVEKNHISIESLRESAYVYPDGTSLHERMMELSMDLVFDDGTELELLSIFIQNALISLDTDIKSMVDSEFKTDQRFSIKADRYISFCNWVQESTTSHIMEPLRTGRIILRADLLDSYNERLLFEIHSLNLTINLGNGNITSDRNTSTVFKSFSSLFLDCQDSSNLDQLLHYLNGDDVPFPNLRAFSWDELKTTMTRLGAAINTNISPNHVARDHLPHCQVTLTTHLGKGTRDNSNYTFSDVFKHLVSQSVLMIDNWKVCDKELLDLNEINNIELLQRGKLASFLFGLKNGNKGQKTCFRNIQHTFTHLSGASLDVELIQKNATPGGSVESYVVIRINETISLQNSGSGRAQLVLLSTVAHLDHKIVLLDEPNAFLHPSMQVRVRDIWRRASAQQIVITHSPYMVTSGNMEHIRRMYMHSEARASRVTALMNTEQAIRAGFPKYIRHTDDALFLFAKCVIIVEGFDEVMALPIWFDKWCIDQHGTTGEFLGVHFVNAAGKNRVMPHARMMDALSIPWIGLYDADVLSTGKNKENKRKENKQIVESWEHAGVVKAGSICLGDENLLRCAPLGNKRQLFFTGTDLDGKWEQLPVYKNHFKEAEVAVGGDSPAISRYLAETYPCPEEFYEIFERAFLLANN